MNSVRHPVVRAVIETIENRRLLSAVIQLGDGFALVAGGHGVSTSSSDVARHFGKHGIVSETVEASGDASSPVLPSDATPYTDPDNPLVIGIDKDGLIVQKPSDGEADLPGRPVRNLVAGGATDGVSPIAVVPIGGVDADGLTVQAPVDKPITFREKPDADGIIRTKGVLGSDGVIRSKVILPDSFTGDRTIGNRPASVGGPFNINVVKGSGASGNPAVSAIIDAAAKYVESLFDDSITINIGFN